MMYLQEVTLQGLVYVSDSGEVLIQPIPGPKVAPSNAVSSYWDHENKEHIVYLDDNTELVISYADIWDSISSDPLVIIPVGGVNSQPDAYPQDRNATVLRTGSGEPSHDSAWQKGEIAFDAARNKLLVAKAEGRADEIEVLEFDRNLQISKSGLDCNNSTVNFGNGVTPDLPENAVILSAVVSPDSGIVEPSEWELLRSDGSVDDVVSDASQDVSKRLIKLRGLVVSAPLSNVTLKVFYAIN